MQRIYGFAAMIVVITLAVTVGIRSHADARKPFQAKDESHPLARLSEEVSIQAAGRGNPYINLGDGHDLLTQYEGEARLVAALQANQAKPLSLAIADFDEDGVADLIAGYEGAAGGIVTLLRGNVDAIYPNAPEAQQRKAQGGFTEAPFLSPALVYGVPEAADFVVAGDFDGDSHWDVVIARRGSNQLYLLNGDGKGGLSISRTIILQGGVTALVAGEINRRDGLADIIVGINGEAGAKALVFEGPEGALRAKPEEFNLPAAATSMALGQLDDEYTYDLAIAAGRELMIIHGRDRKLSLGVEAQAEVPPAQVQMQELAFEIRSITVGDFKGRGEQSIALLCDDGKLRIFSRQQQAKNRAQLRKINAWDDEVLASGEWSANSQVTRLKASGLPLDNILITDPESQNITIANRLADKSETKGSLNLTLTADSGIVGAAAMRLNTDALSDLVLLRAAKDSPVIIKTEPQQAFSVTNTNDSGPGSLRQAILDANNNPGNDTITFNIGSGVQTIMPIKSLPGIFESVTIDATTQPGFNGSPLIVVSGEKVEDGADGLAVFDGSAMIRGLVINHFSSNAILLTGNPSLVEGNYIGTDVSGKANIGNGESGIQVFSQNNIIGGTTASARNVIAGGVPGIDLGEAASDTLIQGNYIGTDVTGTRALSNSACGAIHMESPRNTIGGTTARAKNLISGNSTDGIRLNGTAATDNLIQGNFIGTDLTGTNSLKNTLDGIHINNAPNNTLGGTVAAARNLISANDGNGISVGLIGCDPTPGQFGVIIEGNYIGTDITGAHPLGNQLHGIFVENNAFLNIIGGAEPTTANIIAFNGGSGVRIPDEPVSPDIPKKPAVQILIVSNSIFANAILGIDLGAPGITSNDDKDLDGGANELQNFPVLANSTLASSNLLVDGVIIPAATVMVSGTFNSTPNQRFILQFFFGTNVDASGHQFVGAIPIRLDPTLTVNTDGNGNAPITYTFTLPTGVNGGWVNATAVDPLGNTSELSNSIQVGVLPPVPRIIGVSKNGKNLAVTGSSFVEGAKIFINGEQRKTIYESDTTLIGKKAAKGLPSGARIKVRNPDGSESNEWTYQ